MQERLQHCELGKFVIRRTRLPVSLRFGSAAAMLTAGYEAIAVRRSHLLGDYCHCEAT